MLKRLVLLIIILVGMVACSSDSVTDTVPLAHNATPVVVPQIKKATPVVAPQIKKATSVVVPQIKNTKPPLPTPTLHPLITGKTPPPVNLPTPKPTPLPEKPFIPLLPATDTPVLVSAFDGKPFRGRFSGEANVTIQDEMIVIVTESGKTLNIAYRLPSSMTALPERTFAGSVTMKEETTYATAHKWTAINDEIGLLLAQVHDSSSTPMIVDVGSEVMINQNPVSVPEDSDSPNVPVNVSTNLDSSTVVPGQTSTVQSEIGDFQIHLQESGYYLADPYSTDPFTGYKTHLWIVRTD